LGDPDAVIDLLGRPGVLRAGHFRLLSGLHADRFVVFSRLVEDDHALDMIAGWLLPTIAPWAPDVVIAPSTAGVALGGAIGRRLGAPLELASLDDQGRPNGLLGSPDLDGRRTLLVNDIVTTGDGMAALAEVASQAGATVCGGAWFLSRSEVAVHDRIGAPTASVGYLDLPATRSSECPDCADHRPLEDALDLN
jgi:orotate phosphoribosyltransferase